MTICPLQYAQYQTLAMDVIAGAVARCPIWSFCLDLVVLPKAIWSFCSVVTREA
jgi:hypothetical protein